MVTKPEKLVTWQYKNEKKWFFIFITLSVIAPALAFFFSPDSEPAETWFQRSGSIMILCAVVAEYNLIRIKTVLSPDYSPITRMMDLTDNFSKLSNRYSKIAGSVAIIGTFIWGYGDWFYGMMLDT